MEVEAEKSKKTTRRTGKKAGQPPVALSAAAADADTVPAPPAAEPAVTTKVVYKGLFDFVSRRQFRALCFCAIVGFDLTMSMCLLYRMIEAPSHAFDWCPGYYIMNNGWLIAAVTLHILSMVVCTTSDFATLQAYSECDRQSLSEGVQTPLLAWTKESMLHTLVSAVAVAAVSTLAYTQPAPACEDGVPTTAAIAFVVASAVPMLVLFCDLARIFYNEHRASFSLTKTVVVENKQ